MDDNTPGSRLGWWPRAKAALFGMPDPVQSELKELSEQGAGLARAAHFFAFLMLVLFSLGSLVGVAGASTTAVIDAWQAGRIDLIHAISTSVSTALVLCMDVGALYAAAMIRIIAARGSGDMRLHWTIIIVADAIEAASYVYMSWLYDLPTSPLIWGLIISRAIAAPFFAVYLSLARPLPVASPDMLHMVEMASGAGLIKDVTLIASDAAAPVARKAEIYGAAARMAPDDRSRLDGVIKVLQKPAALDPMLDALLSGAVRIQPPLETPPDGGSPVAARPARRQRLDPSTVYGVHLLEEPAADGGTAPRSSRAKAASKPRKATMVMKAKATKRIRDPRTDEQIKDAIRAFVEPAIAAGRKLPSNQAIARGVNVSTSTASKWRNIILAEQDTARAAQILPLAR